MLLSVTDFVSSNLLMDQFQISFQAIADIYDLITRSKTHAHNHAHVHNHTA